jgi:hypothetical protein
VNSQNLSRQQFFNVASEQGNAESLLKTIYNNVFDQSDVMFLGVGESGQHRALTNYMASEEEKKKKKKTKETE